MKAVNPSVIFLVYREGLGPIFSSVYINPAEQLGKLGINSRIVVMSSAGEFIKPKLRRRWNEFAAEIRQKVPGGVTRLPSPPAALRNLPTDPMVLRAWAALEFRRRRPDIIHCGASQAACLALDLRRRYPAIRVVYHSWGPEAPEYLYSHGNTDDARARAEARRFAERLDAAQARAMQESDAVICISRPMIRWAKERYGIDDSRILLVPCFVDVEHFAHQAKARDAVRRQLGFGDELVVAYCGSMISWQLSAKSLEALAVVRRLRPDTRFLGLTMHQSTLRRLLREVGFPEARATLLTVPHWEVPRYLAAADLGMIGRSLMQGPDVVNEISSPIKFGEYLACGTPVLMSEGIGDFSDLARNEGVGAVLPFHATAGQAETVIEDFVAQYEADLEKIRAHCQRIAWRELDIRQHIEELAALYNRFAAGL